MRSGALRLFGVPSAGWVRRVMHKVHLGKVVGDMIMFDMRVLPYPSRKVS